MTTKDGPTIISIVAYVITLAKPNNVVGEGPLLCATPLKTLIYKPQSLVQPIRLHTTLSKLFEKTSRAANTYLRLIAGSSTSVCGCVPITLGGRPRMNICSAIFVSKKPTND
ncbi:MAG: hypothetical protein EOO52_01295 [Gammaproteobacteria bacterium]|nr:MAG: hypothetical protein EOO52_01295 [Gammaproteobacteria bacterium]